MDAPKTSSPSQHSVRTTLIRGGSSKGVFFHAADLPPAGPVRDRLIARIMGAPDVLQIDGLGGSRPITSKVAIIALSERDDADVDYTFAQVDIASGVVGYQGNCGNISSGVGPFAVDEGLVKAEDGAVQVRIWNTNTQKLLIAEVPVVDGLAVTEGDYQVPGVPGTGAEIKMNWAATVGAVTGKLLPTGAPIDAITLEDGRLIEASLFDAANPCVWVRGEDFGLTGSESIEDINGDAALLARVGELRAKAAALFGFVEDWRLADRRAAGLPILGLISRPARYKTPNGAWVEPGEMDLRLHLLFMGVMHESVAGTASICLAAASRTPGSLVYALTANLDKEVLRIGHPSGVTPAEVAATSMSQSPFVAFKLLGFSRTARRIMDGRAYFPASLLGNYNATVALEEYAGSESSLKAMQ